MKDGNFFILLFFYFKNKVYPVALEEVPDFNGFNSPFLNLPFYKGKQLEDHASESRITGFFKVTFFSASKQNVRIT